MKKPSGLSISYFDISVILEPLRETPGYKRLVRLYSKSES